MMNSIKLSMQRKIQNNQYMMMRSKKSEKM